MAEDFNVSIGQALRREIDRMKETYGCETDLQALIMSVSLATRAGDYLNDAGEVVVLGPEGTTRHSIHMLTFKNRK